MILSLGTEVADEDDSKLSITECHSLQADLYLRSRKQLATNVILTKTNYGITISTAVV